MGIETGLAIGLIGALAGGTVAYQEHEKDKVKRNNKRIQQQNEEIQKQNELNAKKADLWK